MSETVAAIVAFGSNLGQRAETIQAAADELAAIDGIELVKLAPVIETPALRPYGLDPEAPAYLNTVALIDTTLSAPELHTVLQEIEDAHGRERATRWGDRTLDLDLIIYGDVQQDDPQLTLPHPRAHERDFVLRPWATIDPLAELPGHGPISDLLDALAETAT
ncbi:2-amino-4-hydroxy-6-hydroxymethyldihydropteridine diphosphokinase [Salinibacterium sp. ZJ70]|uniref:2-amino-4-hydroxy-6- hydroxymethyldihydropteridine diphosphokinase n=1 Tax=Salinibacterium sp. ZJ70 TaxID=2708084 RepID=UPI00141E8583|nr:2-amino-4-hydroxy-6-hydroxymethyldihydropteridine diphosphokinase [Salinibacterium sp. ZJ70]